MADYSVVRVRHICGLCGKPIDNKDQVASLHVTLRSGGDGSVEIHVRCIQPHVHPATADDMMNDAATFEERQRRWDDAWSKGS